MHLRALTTPWFRPLCLAVAIFGAIAALASLTPITEASAESGRRICRYVWDQSVGNPERRYVSFVADYKEKGACPDVDNHKVTLPKDVGSWMPPPDTWAQAPVPKLTCEEFQDLLTLPSEGANGGDPCTYMQNDMLYAVTSYLDDDSGSTRRFWDLGSIWDLRRD